jgi:hypothetical protein
VLLRGPFVNRKARRRRGRAGWTAAEAGQTVAATPPDAGGAQVLAIRAGDGLKLARQPEGGNPTLPSQAALDLLVGVFPAARQKLEALGFGLAQQGGRG